MNKMYIFFVGLMTLQYKKWWSLTFLLIFQNKSFFFQMNIYNIRFKFSFCFIILEHILYGIFNMSFWSVAFLENRFYTREPLVYLEYFLLNQHLFKSSQNFCLNYSENCMMIWWYWYHCSLWFSYFLVLVWLIIIPHILWGWICYLHYLLHLIGLSTYLKSIFGTPSFLFRCFPTVLMNFHLISIPSWVILIILSHYFYKPSCIIIFYSALLSYILCRHFDFVDKFTLSISLSFILTSIILIRYRYLSSLSSEISLI